MSVVVVVVVGGGCGGGVVDCVDSVYTSARYDAGSAVSGKGSGGRAAAHGGARRCEGVSE